MLDLTMRNSMLNLRTTKTIVELTEGSPAKVAQLLRENRLAEIVGEDNEERFKILKKLFRDSRNSFNENGTNTLYVSLGALRWFEKNSQEPRIAPIIFIPLEIVRQKAMTFEIRMLDEDPMLNVTLFEMLRRDYGITFPELATVPMLENDSASSSDKGNSNYGHNGDFPDWKKIFKVLHEQIKDINAHLPANRKWRISRQSFIGLFSFSKFLMWHDISENEEQVRSHELLGNLSESIQIRNASQPLKASDIEADSNSGLVLPIDYDSSQLAAVAEADRGTSFVLHGPPGTGKSQTITNIIANSLMRGKRVLFVSEKKAALEVVQSRLAEIGLGPFCLELHGNKVQKGSFFKQILFRQLSMVGKKDKIEEIPPSHTETVGRLGEMLSNLRELTNLIHGKRDDNMSLYEFISKASTLDANELNLTDEELATLSPEDVSKLADILRHLDTVEQILGHHPSASPLLGLYPYENTAEAQNELQQTLKNLLPIFEKVRKKARGIINRWFQKRSPEDILSRREEWQNLEGLAYLDVADDIDSKEESVRRWDKAIDGLRKWHHFVERASTMREEAPTSLRHYLERHSGADTADAFTKGYLNGKAHKIVNGDNNLRTFNGMLHDKEIASYREADSAFLAASSLFLTTELRNRLKATSLNDKELEEMAILERRKFNDGRGVPLRQVISDSRHVLRLLFPCMLMSPLSVAQFLEMRPGLFDLVVFDEASQMETPDAIGAIARGKQTIIVGDPKQLPPTSFFMAGSGNSEDEEESQDTDSILEDALAIGMPSLYLTRHYRSRHESLIAFSNHMFYDGRLLTFPSVNDSEQKVTHIDPNGVYDHGKTRTNIIEAQAVVDYLIDRFENYNGEDVPSVGIVTFSKPQCDLIEDLMSAALSENKTAFENLSRAKQPVFVKNLENVQGDERDIIIFSVGYGPDEDGKVSLNFGPVNKQGGERRLNVAVTRAKEEMVVFSSLRPEHIPDRATMSKGALALRAFISYAMHGILPRKEGEDSINRDLLAESIASRLREEGLEVDTNVGRSDFRVDLAIVDPKAPESYRLGIILDGMNYALLATVRDREITVPKVLHNLGWRLSRVWALDWLDNPETVIGRILKSMG